MAKKPDSPENHEPWMDDPINVDQYFADKREIQRDMLLVNELIAQTDRGVAVLGSSMIENSLESYIKARLRRDDSRETKRCTENLFGRSRPLGTFSAKIDIAYATRLIGVNTLNDLHDVRHIRNEFAHTLLLLQPHGYEELAFDSPSIAGRCNRLSHASKSSFQLAENTFLLPDSPRNCYILTVIRLAWELARIARHFREHGDVPQFASVLS